MGLAPSSWRYPRHPNRKSGTRHNRKAKAFVHLLERTLPMPSVILAKIHSGVQTGDLIAVAVELQRVAHREFADSALFRRTPTGMVDVRIHVGIETILVRRCVIP